MQQSGKSLIIGSVQIISAVEGHSLKKRMDGL